jgi:hypothetical protein
MLDGMEGRKNSFFLNKKTFVLISVGSFPSHSHSRFVFVDKYIVSYLEMKKVFPNSAKINYKKRFLALQPTTFTD